MEIRTAVPSDSEELIELSQSSILKTCREDYTQPQLKAWANGINRPNRFKEAIKNQYFIVAEIDNEIVGFASLENGNYIDFLYVSTQHLRKGVAQCLYNCLLNKALESNQQCILSDVSITATSFFKKQGFTIVNKQEHTIATECLVNYRMKYRISG